MKESTLQLELDLGMLTVEQQGRVDSFKREQERNVIRRTSIVKHEEALLLLGGFQLGIDFVNDFKCR